ncbi:hypothetical protein CRI93_04345 [Longimonas halophila]|uniref:Uncharacterized protein n=1 Tax=Longimonas halophila TaxID=1469170 RepID=A0A2H3P8W0_9BACT|nr:hypothetical protein [Longimonas halophila]PEN08351.1 hypothetical protein CRI93_04345 [Longimonas halophila]
MAASVIQDALELLRTQSVVEAIDCLEAAVVETPAYPAAYVLLARAYEARKNWGAARSAWDQAYVLMPHSPTVQDGRTRVRSLIRKQRRAEASSDRPASPDAPRSQQDADAPSATPSNAPTDEALPSLSMDDGPADLEALRAQADQAAQDHAAAAFDSEAPSSAEALDQIDDDLDALIEELQSARIRPDPNIDDLPPDELDDDIDDMVSETLARIYASQGAYHEAARVYVQLAAQEPDRSEERLREASKMRQKARAQDDSSGEQ